MTAGEFGALILLSVLRRSRTCQAVGPRDPSGRGFRPEKSPQVLEKAQNGLGNGQTCSDQSEVASRGAGRRPEDSGLGVIDLRDLQAAGSRDLSGQGRRPEKSLQVLEKAQNGLGNGQTCSDQSEVASRAAGWRPEDSGLGVINLRDLQAAGPRDLSGQGRRPEKSLQVLEKAQNRLDNSQTGSAQRETASRGAGRRAGGSGLGVVNLRDLLAAGPRDPSGRGRRP